MNQPNKQTNVTERTEPKRRYRKLARRGLIWGAVILIATPYAVLSVLWFYPGAEVTIERPKLFAKETAFIEGSETEEEALTRRTEEIFLEQATTYWKDAEKKALAEKADALNARIASTTELTPEDAENARNTLNRAKANLR